MSDFRIITIEKSASSEVVKENYSLNQQGITSWLLNKNIITKPETVLSFEDLMPWMRTGGETYCTSFRFATIKQAKTIFIKALVTLTPEKSLSDWTKRRKILQEENIPVSNWYYNDGAIIIEDYYPQNAEGNVSFETILSIGYKLDKLGFRPLKFIDDLRVDKNNNPYFVDFGFDLGEPSEIPTSTAREYLEKKFPRNVEDISNYYRKNLNPNFKNESHNFRKKYMNTKITSVENVTMLIANSIKKAQKEELFFEEIYSDAELPKGKNEFLFFIKPEITVELDSIRLIPILELIQSKIKEFGLKIHSIKVLSANYLDRYDIIAQHYGVINKIARNAVENMSATAKDRFKEIYGKAISEAKVLGGIEFLTQYPCFNAESLDYLWQNKKCSKLAGGTYCLDVKLDDEVVFLVNGFHARQLQQFTDKGRSIVVMTLSGDLSWANARNNFIGLTFPPNANEGSLRRELLKQKDILGLPEVSQAMNGVHLSAGPVESLIELRRYNSDFSDSDRVLDYGSFEFGKKLLLEFGDAAEIILSNSNVSENGREISIFDLTEEKDSEEAIEILGKYFKPFETNNHSTR